jgi:rhodanese-related sulfurtransferase
VTFNREIDGQKVVVDADNALAQRLMQITPAELFKTVYNQNVNLIMLDVRSESDYNLYHINGALNVPLDKLPRVIPDLLTEPSANSVFVLMSNDETAATEAWKQLVASAIPNVISSKAASTTGSPSSARKRISNPHQQSAKINLVISSPPRWVAGMNHATRILLNMKNWNLKQRSNSN